MEFKRMRTPGITFIKMEIDKVLEFFSFRDSRNFIGSDIGLAKDIHTAVSSAFRHSKVTVRLFEGTERFGVEYS